MTDQLKTDKKKETPALKPDPETQNTPDPQENMEGPISSMVQKVKDVIKKNDKESKEIANKIKEQNM